MLKPQFLIGATASGSGKTTFTLGLLRAFRNRGMNVQPFKCGPDYLDTKHHQAAAGQESYNLDTFLSSGNHVSEIYTHYSEQADICITEGVMGLFDGYDRMQGSSAEIAKILQLPVILIINARSSAYTVAAILYGFKHFQPEIQIAGVIFNFVGSEFHYEHLKQACRDVGVEALGYLPKCKDIEIPSRHLGLNIDNDFCFDAFADRVAAQIEETVNLRRLLEITSVPTFPVPKAIVSKSRKRGQLLRISVAYDQAFNFIYPENIRVLGEEGQITYFSPLRDKELPPSDFVYLPGGYPEFHLSQLSQNESMRRSILRYCQGQGQLFAECGGMMYLCEYIKDEQGTLYPMCGYLPQGVSMENMKLHMGYRKIIIGNEEWRGHEFHYSKIIPGTKPLPSIAKVLNAKNRETDTPVYKINRVVASYIHFYWGEKTILEI